jgi:hypothetical protein
MKTPEELAEEYTNQFSWNDPREEDAQDAFLAGYQAAKDQVADADKVIKPTDTVGKEELNCMIAHFENEDYKISVMVPGILPKAEGGELVRGCGLIVYDISKKLL